MDLFVRSVNHGYRKRIFATGGQNEAAKVALSSFREVDLFIVDYTAPEQTRKEMVGWLKANYPKVKILALNPLTSGVDG